MEGFNKYIDKHGLHFTEELAVNVIKCRWTPEEIERVCNTLVYYNVSGATFGDIIYLVNRLYPRRKSKIKCVKSALRIIGDVNSEGYAFDAWRFNVFLGRMKDVDLMNYI